MINSGGDQGDSRSAINGMDGHEPEVDKELWAEWLKVISDWSTYKSKQSEHIRDLVRRGVPTNLRAKIWKLLANVQQVTTQTSQQYQDMLKQSSNCEKLIQRDIARTYPENDYFKDEAGPGQEGLFNVIKAYSLHDEEVGYCQGSAFIVGLLLLQLDEEESFLLLCKIMQEYRMREIYKPTMAELGLCIYQLECLVQELLPELYVHFQTQNFYTSMYSSSWFLTLFTSNLPLSLAYRVMDLFLSEGLDMIFMLSVAILQISKEDLLKLDMEGLLRYFQKEMPSRIDCDPDYLIKCACQIKYDSKKMKKLCKDYTNIKHKEQEEAIEFRRLRTENRLLQDRLKMLELESKELADKLIKGQVCRAQEAEENFAIKNELSQMRTLDVQNRAIIERLENKVAEQEKLLQDRTINYSEEAQKIISALQEELVAVRIRDAENHVEIKQLNKKITEQELYIKSLRENVPEDPIAQLQEELSAVKLREAEATFAMKELRSKFDELQNLWFEHLQQVHGLSPSGAPMSSASNDNSPTSTATASMTNASNQAGSCSLTTNDTNNSINSNSQHQSSQPSSLSSSIASSNPISKFFNNSVIKLGSSSARGNGQVDEQQELHRLKQEMLTIKLHEADSLAEVKMLRSREMELETQIKIQENKFKRKEEEFKKVEQELADGKSELAKVINQLKDEQRKLIDLEWKLKEEQLMMRMRDVEHIRVTGELKQKIMSYEAKDEEITTAKKIDESGEEPKDASEYQARVAEFQSESFRLDASNRKLQDIEKKNIELEKEGRLTSDEN